MAQMLRNSMMGQPICSFNFDGGNPATLTEFKNSCVQSVKSILATFIGMTKYFIQTSSHSILLGSAWENTIEIYCRIPQAINS
jgi:hypothetical protein